MSHVFLIGFMGAGKSTVGTLLSERLGVPLIDLDAMIEQQTGRSVSEIFAGEGEAAFRELEQAALSAACAGPDAVIACGGGVVLRDENRARMRACGTVVLLSVSAEEAVARIGDTSGRPLLSGDSARMARTILHARLALYRATAHHVVDTAGRSVSQVADEIAAAISDRPLETIHVSAGHGYDIAVGVGMLDTVGPALASTVDSRHVALVTDSVVAELLGDVVRASLVASGFQVSAFVVPAGERSKSWTQAGSLLESFAASGLDRASVVVALGGGVVGDLAGFCASAYMRGIALVHLPSTLLAQVDSAIGGKTGVDLSAGKNLAGAFWQPSLVLSDIAVLQTLPDDEWQNGLVEVVKTAFLQGEAEVAYLERNAAHLLSRDEHVVRHVVVSCARFKADVVAEDEREAGRRECLNLGHTLGHAVEKVAGYGTVSHGVAVAEGMRFAAGLAERTIGAAPELSQRVAAILDALGVPRLQERFGADAVKKAMLADKKNRDAAVRFVLVKSPGEWIVDAVDGSILDEALDRWSAER